VLAAAVAASLLTAVSFDATAWLDAPRSTNLLPVFAAPEFRQNYRLLDGAHFVDLANQYLLVAPAAWLGLSLVRIRRGADPTSPFLLVAALGPLLFTGFANPEVGPFRDWDTFSFAAIPLTVLVARAVARGVSDRGRLAHAAVVICGASALHTAAWIALNANGHAAEQRFVRLLETCPISQHARAYGWESLGSSRLSAGRTEEACAAFENAILAAPDNPRYRVAAGKLHLGAGRAERARERFAEAVHLDPSRAEAWFGLGTIELGRRDLDAALVAFRAAVRAQPDFAPGWFNVGAVLRQRGETAAARDALSRYLALEPSGPMAGEARAWIEAR
jgi:tetratricopeptide (TPR) repeat protein